MELIREAIHISVFPSSSDLCLRLWLSFHSSLLHLQHTNTAAACLLQNDEVQFSVVFSFQSPPCKCPHCFPDLAHFKAFFSYQIFLVTAIHNWYNNYTSLIILPYIFFLYSLFSSSDNVSLYKKAFFSPKDTLSSPKKTVFFQKAMNTFCLFSNQIQVTSLREMNVFLLIYRRRVALLLI